MNLSRGRVPAAAATGTVRRQGRRGLTAVAGLAVLATLASACSSSKGSQSSASSAAGSSPAAAAGSSSASASTPASPATSGSPAAYKCSSSAVKLSMWGWAAGYNLAVTQFNKTHPDICVTLENNGAAGEEYTKIGDVVKAGSGAPDLAEVEYFELPSLEITHDLLDLSQYGANDHKADIAPVAWSQVSQGSSVYAMPVDLGPLGLYYDSKVFSQYNLAVPATWTQFASEAAQLHQANSKAAITNFDPATAQEVLALMQQAGAFPFKYAGGSNLTINFTGSAQMAFANYWQKLIDAHEVTTLAEFSPGLWSAFDSGSVAARLSPAWGQVGMGLNVKSTLGDWRAAPIPQQSAGQKLSGNWGGSTIAVMKSTKHPKEAAQFAEWFGGSADAWSILSGPVAGAFPGYLPLLNSATFQAQTINTSGDSHPQTVFAQAAQNMIAPQWPPIMTAALTQWTDIFAGVTKGTETLPDAFKAYQASLTKYAQAQGFKVSTS